MFITEGALLSQKFGERIHKQIAIETFLRDTG